tara:strand:+ start:24934 stop:25158 length:225 start_codon:yes stop_codon:yes gene_type:complete
MSNPNSVTVSQVSDVTTVEITTQGPQGPSFAASGKSLNDSNVVDGSIVRFNQSSDTFIADNTVTVTNIVDGGNF